MGTDKRRGQQIRRRDPRVPIEAGERRDDSRLGRTDDRLIDCRQQRREQETGERPDELRSREPDDPGRVIRNLRRRRCHVWSLYDNVEVRLKADATSGWTTSVVRVASGFSRTVTVRPKAHTTYELAGYSARSAIIGSTRVARRAGTNVATNETTATSAATAR
jgi:hypothetical protein